MAATSFALESVLELSSRLADAGDDRHPDRGGAGQALRLRARLAGRRRARPDPRRARVRDRRLPARPRRAGHPGRADPSRPADQPDLRGIDRDHASADRARGRGHPPRGGRRHHRPRRRPRRQDQGRRPGRPVLRRLAADARGRTPATAPARTPSSARSPPTSATSSARAASLARWTFYGMARWQGAMERRQAYLGRLVDIGAELFAITATCVRAHDLAERGGPEAATAVDLADAFCGQSRDCGSPRCSPRCGATPTGPTAGLPGASSPATSPGRSPGWSTTHDDRPWIASTARGRATGRRTCTATRSPEPRRPPPLPGRMRRVRVGIDATPLLGAPDRHRAVRRPPRRRAGRDTRTGPTSRSPRSRCGAPAVSTAPHRAPGRPATGAGPAAAGAVGAHRGPAGRAAGRRVRRVPRDELRPPADPARGRRGHRARPRASSATPTP